MKTLIKPLDKSKVVNDKWEVLNKSYTDSFGSSYCNCRCLTCGDIKCVQRSKINNYKCNCEK